MSVKLFNQGKRIIHGEAVDPRDGKKKPFAFLPKTALEFDDELARKLKKMFGAEMLSIEDVKSHFDGAHSPAESPPAPSQPATNQAIDVSLSGLTEDEKVAVLALRAAKLPEVAPLAQPAIVKAEPSDFVNVTEEEGKAALAAIQAIRIKNAAANPDAPENQPASIMQRVRDVLAGKESA